MKTQLSPAGKFVLTLVFFSQAFASAFASQTENKQFPTNSQTGSDRPIYHSPQGKIIDKAFSCEIPVEKEWIYRGRQVLDQNDKPVMVSKVVVHTFRSEQNDDLGYTIQTRIGAIDYSLANFNLHYQRWVSQAILDGTRQYNNEKMEKYNKQLRQYEAEVSRVQALPNKTDPQHLIPQPPQQPQLTALPLSIDNFTTRYNLGNDQRNKPNTSLSISVGQQSVANLKCKKTPHNVRETVGSVGEGKAYQGGQKKNLYNFNQGHMEDWCDSSEMIGELYISSLGGMIPNVKCSYAPDAENIGAKIFLDEYAY